jgi:hypothetical protein
MKRVLLVLLLLAGASGTTAETCTSNASGRWTAVGTGPWTGCTASADDTFNAASGHRVEVAGAVTVTTGLVVVQSGGELELGIGGTLNPGASLTVQDGGTLRMLGQRVAGPCYVEREPVWTAATPTTTTGCDLTNASAATDYIVWSDEDPPGEHLFTRRTLLVGPGRATGRNVYKASPARWAWSDITNITGQVLTWDIDETATVGVAVTPNIPYFGTRGNPTTTAISAAQMTLTRLEGGRMTRATVALAYGSVSAVNGDLAGYYLYANETVANSADPTYCSGRQAKILHSVDGGAGDDVLYVAGNLANCTNATWRVIPFGVRRGDAFYVVRPATIDGNQAGTLTGYVVIESGATVAIKHAVFRNLGVLALATPTPDIARNCNLCFYQSSTSPGATISGYFTDSMVVRSEHGATDTAIIHFDSKVTSATGDLRYPNTGLLNLSGLRLERLFVYGSRDAASGTNSGGHGFYVDGAKNLTVDGLRVQRVSDDGVAVEMGTNTTGTATDENSVTLRRVIVLEQIAEADTSQESFEVTGINQTNAQGTNDHLVNLIRVYDLLALGAYSRPLHLTTANGVYERFVTGGQQFYNTSVHQSFEFFGYDLSDNTKTLLTDGNVLRDSILNVLAEDFTSAIYSANFTYARVSDSIIGDGIQLFSTPGAWQYSGLAYTERTFIRAAGTSSFAIETPVVHWQRIGRVYDDSAMVTTATGAYAWANNCIDGFPVRAFRVAMITAQTSFFPGGAGVEGPWAYCGLGTGETFTGGGYYSDATAANESFDLVSGSTLYDTCFETTQNVSDAFGARATARTRVVSSLLPNTTTDTAIGLLVGDPASSDPCEAARPRELGISQVGMAHVLLGDFAAEQFYPAFTSRVGLLNTVAAGGVGAAAAPRAFP